MPRSIYQQNERQYIGHDILFLWSTDYETRWDGSPNYGALINTFLTYDGLRRATGPRGDFRSEFCPVYDRELNDWIWLNADVDAVDYVVHDVKHNQATISWLPNYDFQKIHIMVNAPGVPERKFDIAPGRDPFLITGLTERTTYEVNVLATLPWGITKSNRQTFTTPANPIPGPPTRLRYTKRTNASITLQWDRPQYAVRYAVYRAVGHGGFQRVATVSGTTAKIALKPDTKYRFAVRGINADGQAGPYSNHVKSATGHDESRRRGSVRRLALPPRAWNSWRRDRLWDTRPAFTGSLYQGYWTRGGIGRWWGVLEYDPSRLQRIIDQRFGSGTWSKLRVTEASIRKVYRQRMPGNNTHQWLEWHLTNSKAGSQSGPWINRPLGGEPSVYGRHVNRTNSADSLAWQYSLAAGQYIDFLRIPRRWGEAIIKGRSGSTSVRGLCLYRGDNENNGYGYGGYMKISGHHQQDFYYRDSWRRSDLSLMISANWDYVVTPYKAPYNW